jgi:hypothetical protein
MSNLNALFSTSSKTPGSRASASKSSASKSSASTPRLISQSSGSSFDSDDSIAPLFSESTMQAKNDGIILIIFVFIRKNLN